MFRWNEMGGEERKMIVYYSFMLVQIGFFWKTFHGF